MLGLMQDMPLLISQLIDFAARHHGDAEIVSRRVEGDLHRYTYRDAARRARQVANALDRLDLPFSGRVATLAWNGYRHFELYYGVSGSGRVVHTLNPRLAPDQVAWIANHAEDLVLCFDMTFLPVVKAIWPKCMTIKHWIALCEAPALPVDTGIPGLRATNPGSRARASLTRGRASTSAARQRFATQVVPPATPRACSTATGRPCCMLTAQHCRMRWRFRRESRSCRWCRCSTSTHGASPTRRR